MIHQLCETHSMASVYLAHLRDINVQSNRATFRKNTERLGGVFAYEISKTFEYKSVKTETPLGTATSYFPKDDIVLLTILRAGLPLHHGMLDVLGAVNNGFIAAQRMHHKDGTFEVNVDYITCPDIEGKTVILCDPMLATGVSMNKALKAICNIGTPKKIHIVSVVASRYGINYIHRLWPDAELWVAGIDEELTAKSYIVPGLGDAGDLAYGGKRDE